MAVYMSDLGIHDVFTFEFLGFVDWLSKMKVELRSFIAFRMTTVADSDCTVIVLTCIVFWSR